MVDEVPTLEELQDAIVIDAASGIQETIVDGTTIRTMDIEKRLAVLKELSGGDIALPSSNTFGMRITKFIPGGAG